MGSVFSSGKSKEEIEMALAKATEIVNSNAVVVFRSASFFSLIGFFFFSMFFTSSCFFDCEIL